MHKNYDLHKILSIFYGNIKNLFHVRLTTRPCLFLPITYPKLWSM